MIDEKKLIAELKEWKEVLVSDSSIYSECIEAVLDVAIRKIEGQPKVPEYNVDNVVDKLKECACTMSTEKPPHSYFKAVGLNKAIEIVKGGGRDNVETFNCIR